MAYLTFEKDFPRHPLHYFTLICLQLVGLWGLFWFDYDRAMQLSIVVSMAVSYVIWGIIHHRQHKDLHPKIVLEYVLMAFLAVLIIGFLLYRT